MNLNANLVGHSKEDAYEMGQPIFLASKVTFINPLRVVGQFSRGKFVNVNITFVGFQSF